MRHEQYTEATILCPGKSLDLYDRDRDALPGGPVIAVNTAMAERPESDVWCIWGLTIKELDARLSEWGTTFRLLRGDGDGAVPVWAIKAFAQHNDLVTLLKPHHISWDDHLRRHGFDWWIKSRVVHNYLGWTPRIAWDEIPALSAAMVAMKNGAKHVRIIGADMRGMGYAGVEGGDLKWRDAEDDDHRRRWKKERTALQLAVQECPQHGVTLEVVDLAARAVAPQPEPEPKPYVVEPEPVEAD